MIRRSISLAGLACLLTIQAPVVASQDPEAADRLPVAEDVEMAEDVEIMGEVLRRAMAEVYTPRVLAEVWLAGNPECARCHTGPVLDITEDGLLESSERVNTNSLGHLDLGDRSCQFSCPGKAAVEPPMGAYLEGYGIVYQLRLDVPPPEQQQPEDTADKDNGDPGVGRPWDNALRALRGQPPLLQDRVKEKPVLPTRKDLANRLLDVFTENVGNLRCLGPFERLTVAITFPGSKGQCSAMNRDPEGEVGVAKALHDFDEMFPPAPYGDVSSVRGSHEVSADLHMRQQNYQKAVEGYQKAIEALGDSKPRNALALKLIQAYVGLGELEKAEQLIKETKASESRSENNHASSPNSAAIPVPAKLIVSATVCHLCDVAAGKTAREELEKQATIQYFNSPSSTYRFRPRRPTGKVVPNTYVPNTYLPRE